MDARPIPFEGRIPAIAYIQSNCNSIGKRESIMQTLIELANGTALSVHAMGRCLHNVKGDVKDKIKKYREYAPLIAACCHAAWPSCTQRG